MRITVNRNRRTIHAGNVEETRDQHGNPRFDAVRVDGDRELFWAKSAAVYWVELGGLLAKEPAL